MQPSKIPLVLSKGLIVSCPITLTHNHVTEQNSPGTPIIKNITSELVSPRDIVQLSKSVFYALH